MQTIELQIPDELGWDLSEYALIRGDLPEDFFSDELASYLSYKLIEPIQNWLDNETSPWSIVQKRIDGQLVRFRIPRESRSHRESEIEFQQRLIAEHDRRLKILLPMVDKNMQKTFKDKYDAIRQILSNDLEFLISQEAKRQSRDESSKPEKKEPTRSPQIVEYI